MSHCYVSYGLLTELWSRRYLEAISVSDGPVHRHTLQLELLFNLDDRGIDDRSILMIEVLMMMIEVLMIEVLMMMIEVLMIEVY